MHNMCAEGQTDYNFYFFLLTQEEAEWNEGQLMHRHKAEKQVQNSSYVRLAVHVVRAWEAAFKKAPKENTLMHDTHAAHETAVTCHGIVPHFNAISSIADT